MPAPAIKTSVGTAIGPPRPSPLAPRPQAVYTPALGAVIVDLHASGESLPTVCDRAGMPNVRTVQTWARSLPDFGLALAHARIACASHADEKGMRGLNSIQPGTDPAILRAREAEARYHQWRAERYDPASYGRHQYQQVVVSGSITHEHRVQALAPDWLAPLLIEGQAEPSPLQGQVNTVPTPEATQQEMGLPGAKSATTEQMAEIPRGGESQRQDAKSLAPPLTTADPGHPEADDWQAWG